MAASVPVVDLASFIAGDDPAGDTARTIAEACERIGFLVVSGHGVDEQVIVDAQAAAREFFHLPMEEKRRVQPPVSWHFRGYEPPGGSALAKSLGNDTPPDLCELFRISRFDEPANVAAAAGGGDPELDYFFGPNLWPERPSSLRPALERYYAELEHLAMTIMRLFAIGLGLAEDWFEDKFDRHITNLCVNYYPPQVEPPAPGQLRRGAHSDYGSLTVLYQDDAPGGLEVMTMDGEWEGVPHLPGTFVVNIGDLMAVWTNGRWRSTMHRVVNLPRDDADRERISIPFFHQPNQDAVIECIPTCLAPGETARFDPVTSGEWVRTKTRRQVGAA
ncbi:MAG: 2-oxoglutarate and iron-dependent oxygenase domain-containing protein [Ilumatobacteraceae bacterium]